MYQYLLPVIWLKVDTNLPRSNNVSLTMYISKSTLTHKHKSAFNVQAEGGVRICKNKDNTQAVLKMPAKKNPIHGSHKPFY
jgi:hypothetical protein